MRVVLSVGDEKKAVGRALLGLGSRISVMDSLSETDTKDVASLKAALRREFGNSSRWYQDSFEKRRQQPGETYGMFLSSLRSLFRSAFPGTETDSPVAAALLKRSVFGRYQTGSVRSVTPTDPRCDC